jgi:hypothetical protein
MKAESMAVPTLGTLIHMDRQLLNEFVQSVWKHHARALPAEFALGERRHFGRRTDLSGHYASGTACPELLRGSSDTFFRRLFGFRSLFLGMPLN